MCRRAQQNNRHAVTGREVTSVWWAVRRGPSDVALWPRRGFPAVNQFDGRNLLWRSGDQMDEAPCGFIGESSSALDLDAARVVLKKSQFNPMLSASILGRTTGPLRLVSDGRARFRHFSK